MSVDFQYIRTRLHGRVDALHGEVASRLAKLHGADAEMIGVDYFRVVHGSISCDPTQPNQIQLTRSLQFGSDVFLYTELIGFPYLSDRP